MAQPKEAPGKKTCAASIERSGLLTAIFTMPARLPPAERGGTRALSFGKTPPRFVNKSLFVKGGLAGGIDFFHNRILGQPCQKLDFFVHHGTKAIGQMLPVSTVNGHAFLAVAVVWASLLAGAVIFGLIFLPKVGGELLLKPVALGHIAFMKCSHGTFFFFILHKLLVITFPHNCLLNKYNS